MYSSFWQLTSGSNSSRDAANEEHKLTKLVREGVIGEGATFNGPFGKRKVSEMGN